MTLQIPRLVSEVEAADLTDRLHRMVSERLVATEQYTLFQQRYRNDPAGFCRDCLSWPPNGGTTKYQDEIMTDLATHGRLAVRSLHGSGKTALAAMLVIWFALTRDGEDWKIITTASVERQLVKFLWPEINKWARAVRWDVIGRPPFGRRELTGTMLRLTTGSAFYVVCQNSAAIEGAHAKELFYIFDEAKIIPDSTWDAAEGAFSNAGEGGYNAYWLAISTPSDDDIPSGRFFDIHRRKPGFLDWHTYHITLDSAVQAGRVSSSWAKERAEAWGEESSIYRAKVLGEFPDGATSGVVSYAAARAAANRWLQWRVTTGGAIPHNLEDLYWGVDVGDGGKDPSVLACYSPSYGCFSIEDVSVPEKNQTMRLVGKLTPYLHEYGGSMAIDALGVGTGVFSRLREMQEEGKIKKSNRLTAYKGSEAAKNEMGSALTDRSGELTFANTRSAAYWAVREVLDDERGDNIMIPDDAELIEELCAPLWSTTSGGKIVVEAKESVQARLGRSPNKADALAMAVFRRSVPLRVRALR